MNNQQPRKRRRQSHAQEVEFVVVNNKRLGKQVKAVPLARGLGSKKAATSSHRPQTHTARQPSPYTIPAFEDDIPVKRGRSGKVNTSGANINLLS